VRYHAAHRSRRGSVATVVAVSLTVMMGFVALAVDVGLLYAVDDELQRAADAAALAGAEQLLDEDRLKGSPDLTAEMAAARLAASAIALRNKVYGAQPVVDPAGDVTIGYLADPNNLAEPISFADPNAFNTVQVCVRRDSVRNGPVDLWFARILGIERSDLVARATATFKEGVIGFRVTRQTGNAELVPLALHVDAWTGLLNRTRTTRDNYEYNAATGTVGSGSDGVFELNIYPGSGSTQLPPGNFGTVDIGNPNNSTADISRQIRYGVSQEDLAYFGGELKLGPDGTLLLNGDTGLLGPVKVM